MDKKMIFKDNKDNYYLIDTDCNLYLIDESGDLIQLRCICFEEMIKRFLVFTSESSLKNTKVYENDSNLFILKTKEANVVLSKIDKMDFSIVEKLYHVYNYSFEFLKTSFYENKNNKKYKRIVDLFFEDSTIIYFADGYLELEDNKYFFTKKVKEEVEL